MTPLLQEKSAARLKRTTSTWMEKIHLSPAEARAVYRELQPILPYIRCELTLVALADEIAVAMRRGLTARTLNLIESFAERSTLLQVIEGWPLDSLALPETPSQQSVSVGDIALYASIEVGYCILRGERPISYIHENGGLLLRHVTPRIAQQAESSSHGAEILFPHTDLANKQIAALEPVGAESPGPASLTLFALRSEVSVPTLFSAVGDIVERLPADVVHQLMQPVFEFSAPQSFSAAVRTLTGPAIYLRNGKYFARYGNISAPAGAPQGALTQMKHILTDEGLWLPVILLPGASISIKNTQLLHARMAMSPRFDGGDRWLIRVYGLPPQYVKPVHKDVPFLLP